MKKKSLKIIILSLIAVLLLIAAGTGTIWYRYEKLKGEPIKITKAWSWPSEQTKVGTPLTGSMVIELPWGSRPANGTIEWRNNIAGVPECVIEREGFNWNGTIYKLSATIIAFRSGDFAECGTLKISYDGVKESTLSQEVKVVPLPGIQVEAVEPYQDNQLTLAGEAEKPEQKMGFWFWLLLVTALIAIIVAANVVVIRRRAAANAIKPWDVAEDKLNDLRRQLAGHPDLIAPGVIRVSDIVREYLDQRFDWKSTRQTAEEFLSQLAEHNSPLPKEHKKSLKNFVSAAEMVKFAGEHPTFSMVDSAIDEALTLVEDTKIKPEEQNNESNSMEVNNV